jgi:hypothetical protein
MPRDTGSTCCARPWASPTNTAVPQTNQSTNTQRTCRIVQSGGRKDYNSASKLDASRVSCWKTHARRACTPPAPHYKTRSPVIQEQCNCRRRSHNPCAIVPSWPLQDRTWWHSCYTECRKQTENAFSKNH